MENYITYFDQNFLLQGLALHDSLRRHQPDSVLWVLCLDEKVEQQLALLHPEGLKTISLHSVETPELLESKKNRSRTEYVFTLTPFVYEFVFSRDPLIDRVTYLDADVYFFSDPMRLLGAFIESDKSVFLTEHAFDQRYERLVVAYGRFCVQFLTVKRTARGLEILRAWQQQCLQNCSTPLDGGTAVFGDQKYLDEWPERYPDAAYILEQRDQALAPWNVDYYQAANVTSYFPVLYHFQSFRIFHRKWLQLCFGFTIEKAAHIYAAYLDTLKKQALKLKLHGIPCPLVPFRSGRWWLPQLIWRVLKGRVVIEKHCLFSVAVGLSCIIFL